MLANRIGDTFRFDFAGAAVWAFRRVLIYVVERCMGDFMDCCFDVLQLAHALVDSNTPFIIKTAAFPVAA